MNTSKILLGAAALTLSAAAAAVPTGSWDVTNSANTHGVWFDGSASSSLSQRFSWDSATFTVDAAGSATLSGSVTSNSIAGYSFDVLATFDYLCSGAEVVGSTGCNGDNSPAFDLASQPTGDVNAADVDLATWEYFNLVDADLIGTDALAGFNMDLDRKPAGGNKPFRMGVGANWHDLDFGASGWWHYEVTAGSVGSLSVGDIGDGDFNMDLTAVSEPGTIALLGLGLAGLGVVRRRKA